MICCLQISVYPPDEALKIRKIWKIRTYKH